MEEIPGSPQGDDIEKVKEVSGQVCFEPTLLGVLWAFLEIVLVAVFGSLVTQIAFLWVGFEGTQILDSTRLLFLFMASETCITLLLIGFFLYLRGGTVTRLGWVWKGRQRELYLGVLFLPILFLSTFFVGMFFELLLPQYVSSSNPLLELVQEFEDLGLLLITSIFAGGVKEEVQRAFVLDRFENNLGAILAKPVFFGRALASDQSARCIGVVAGLILWSLFFGLGHQVQGVDNATGAGVLGLLFGLLYVWRRNLVAPIVSHALYDVTTLLIFWNFMT